MKDNMEHIYTANGQLDAEMIRIFLESHGIKAELFRESVGSVYGLTVGPLGEVKIFAPAEQAADAAEILKDMEAGKYEAPGQDEDRVEDDDPELDS